MATVKEVVELLFQADYKGQPEMLKLKKDVTGIGEGLSSGVTAVSGFTAALAALEVAAVATSIGLAKAGVDSAGKFKDSFNEISTLITEISDDDLVKFQNSIKAYASDSTASLESINTAIYNAISAGVSWKNSLGFLAEAEKLSVAGKADLNDVVRVLTGSLNAYGESTNQAGAYSDVLFNTVKNGVTTLPELASQLGQVTGLASNLNVPFDELNATIATLTANGLSTGNAITAIKGALTNIIKPTSEAAKAAESLGIQFDYSALKSKGFSGLMAEIADKAGTNKQAVTQLFGSVEGLNSALALTSKQGAVSFVEKLEELQNSTGATTDAFEKMVENTALIKQNLANNIELTLGAIGEPMLDEFKDIDKAIADIFDGIRNNLGDDGALSVVTEGAERIAETVATILRNMANNMDAILSEADLSGFTNAFDALNEGLLELDLDSPEGLKQAIESLGKAFETLTKFTISAGEVLSGLLSSFGDLAGYFSAFDGDTAQLIGRVGGITVALAALSTAVGGPLIGIFKTLKLMGGIPGALGSSEAIGKITSSIKKLGVAGAALGGGFFAGQWLVEGIDNLAGWSEEASKSSIAGDELVKALDKFKEETGNANASMSDYVDHLKAKRAAELNAVKGVDELSTSQKSLNESVKNSDFEKTIGQLNEIGTVTFDAQGNIEGFELGVNKANDSLKKNETAIKSAGDSLEIYGESAKRASEDLDAVKAFKPIFDLRTAEVKSEAEKIKSIMESLGSSSDAVGQSLSSAFSFLGSDNFKNLDAFGQDSIIKSIETQTKTQEKLAEAQTKMAEAQRKYIEYKNKRMQSGKALIQVDGTGLDVELQSILMKTLELIQIKTSEEEAEFLLGVANL